MPERKSVLIRIDPSLHEALQRWAAAEFRSLNAQIEYLLQRAVSEAGRRPRPAESDTAPEGAEP